MAEFVVKIADERGNVQQHVEQGYSEAEVRDRFSQQGYHVYWVKSQGVMTGGLRRKRKLKQATFRAADSELARIIDQAAERCPTQADSRKRARPG
jgi:type II secretory pathway component PulF